MDELAARTHDPTVMKELAARTHDPAVGGGVDDVPAGLVDVVHEATGDEEVDAAHHLFPCSHKTNKLT